MARAAKPCYYLAKTSPFSIYTEESWLVPGTNRDWTPPVPGTDRDAVRNLMWNAVGLWRDPTGLEQAIATLDGWYAALGPDRAPRLDRDGAERS